LKGVVSKNQNTSKDAGAEEMLKADLTDTIGNDICQIK
jgi:hypothetical protein